jgi:hypothetical protein
VLQVPSGIIVICVITVGSAVQINRSLLSVSTLITCRGYPDTRQVGVRITCNTSQYFTLSDSILPFSSPPTTHSATVEVFDPASTRDVLWVELLVLVM